MMLAMLAAEERKNMAARPGSAHRLKKKGGVLVDRSAAQGSGVEEGDDRPLLVRWNL